MTIAFLEPECYGLNCDPPKNSYVETLTPNVIVFGGGPVGDEVMIGSVPCDKKRHGSALSPPY